MQWQEKNKAVITRGLCAGSTVKEWFWEASHRCEREEDLEHLAS
jgi:hypothetical protein